MPMPVRIEGIEQIARRVRLKKQVHRDMMNISGFERARSISKLMKKKYKFKGVEKMSVDEIVKTLEKEKKLQSEKKLTKFNVICDGGNEDECRG